MSTTTVTSLSNVESNDLTTAFSHDIIWALAQSCRNNYLAKDNCSIDELFECECMDDYNTYILNWNFTIVYIYKAELDDYYEIPSCDEDGNILWKQIEAVTKHPVINKDGTNTMLKITTKEEREVIATKANLNIANT